MTVNELKTRLTFKEFQDWVIYHKQLREQPEPEPLQPGDIMKEFGVG